MDRCHLRLGLRNGEHVSRVRVRLITSNGNDHEDEQVRRACFWDDGAPVFCGDIRRMVATQMRAH